MAHPSLWKPTYGTAVAAPCQPCGRFATAATAGAHGPPRTAQGERDVDQPELAAESGAGDDDVHAELGVGPGVGVGDDLGGGVDRPDAEEVADAGAALGPQLDAARDRPQREAELRGVVKRL